MNIVCMPVGPIQGNCYIVSDDNNVACAIDPGGEPDRIVLTAAKRQLTITHILLTHGHFDHMAAAGAVAKATGAVVCCAPEVAPMVRDPDRHIPFPGFGGVPAYEPDVLLADGDTVTFGDLEAEAIYTPGHSPGDTTFDIAGSLFCGDLLFFRSVGRTDLEGGDFDTLLRSVKRLIDLYPPDTPVYPGHMQATTLGGELAANPFLRGLAPRG
jgi:glyoxylase-like metal-dependent hydrolase (beta-lactamase superfamily II)